MAVVLKTALTRWATSLLIAYLILAVTRRVLSVFDVDVAVSVGVLVLVVMTAIIHALLVRQYRAGGLSLMVVTRAAVVAALLGFVFLGVVVALMLAMTESRDLLSPWISAGLVVALCAMALLGIHRAAPRLRYESIGSLVDSYRTRMVVHLAYVGAMLLVAASLALLSNSLTPYYAAAVFVILGLAKVMPTRGNLSHDEEPAELPDSVSSMRYLLETTKPDSRLL